MQQFFDLPLKLASARGEYGQNYHFDGTNYHFNAGDGEACCLAEVSQAWREGESVHMQGTLPWGEESMQSPGAEDCGTFTAIARPAPSQGQAGQGQAGPSWILERLERTQVAPAFRNTDFSALFLRTNADSAASGVLGVIGDQGQRFFIHFASVTPVAGKPFVYAVTGKTRVRDNICDFTGSIRVELARVEEPGKGAIPGQSHGSLVARLYLRENASQPGTGVITGRMQSNFVLDARGKADLDPVQLYADVSHGTNDFRGRWISYRGKSKYLGFGLRRVPVPEHYTPLDQGVGEFVPVQGVLPRGWQDYADCKKADIPQDCRDKAGRLDRQCAVRRTTSDACKREWQEWWR